MAITYWFFYGYSQPVVELDTPLPIPGVADKLAARLGHEGDWERVVVLLSPSLQPRAVRYHQHDGSQLVPSTSVPAGAGPPGRVRGRRHARLLSGGGREAPPSMSTLAPYLHGEPRSDRGRRRCPAGAPVLVATRLQPWYGFGGGWGRPGPLAESSGPLGPSRYKR